MRVRIGASARNDLIEGFRYYEEQEQGVGDYFLATLYSDIEALRIHGGTHRKEYKNLHRALSHKFPYAIYYTVENDEAIVRAVLDCRRDPTWIRERIRSRDT